MKCICIRIVTTDAFLSITVDTCLFSFNLCWYHHSPTPQYCHSICSLTNTPFFLNRLPACQRSSQITTIFVQFYFILFPIWFHSFVFQLYKSFKMYLYSFPRCKTNEARWNEDHDFWGQCCYRVLFEWYLNSLGPFTQ